MSSEYNSITCPEQLWGVWEDIQNYTNVVLNVTGSESARTLVLYWSHGTTEAPPNYLEDIGGGIMGIKDYIFSDEIVITPGMNAQRVYPVKARWFMVGFKASGLGGRARVVTTYKKTSTRLHVTDGRTAQASTVAPVDVCGAGEMVKISGSALKTLLTDACGNIITVTKRDDASKPTALFTHLRDMSLGGIGTRGQGLSVQLRDASNREITSTGLPVTGYFADIHDPEPDHVVIFVDHTRAMYGLATPGTAPGTARQTHLYAAYRDIIIPIFDFMRGAGHFDGPKPSRLSVVSYGRLDVCFNPQYYSVGDSDNKAIKSGYPTRDPLRTIPPGTIEFSSTKATDISGYCDTIMNLFSIMPAEGSDKNIFKVLNTTDDSIQERYDDDRTLIRPGYAIYPTIRRALSTNAPVGNFSNMVNTVPPADTCLNMATGYRNVMLVVAGGVPLDDPTVWLTVPPKTNRVYTGIYMAHETALCDSNYASAQTQMKTYFGSNIYTIFTNPLDSMLGGGAPYARLVDPCLGHTGISDEDYFNSQLDSRIFDAGKSYVSARNLFIDRALKVRVPSYRALKTAVTDACGNYQASTDAVTDTYFPGNALYYALADGSGNAIATTQAYTSSAALMVTLADEQGGALDTTERGIPIVYTSTISRETKHFDMALDACIMPVAGLNNHTFILRNFGVANESAITAWVKVYDMSAGKNTFGQNMAGTAPFLTMNVPVPALSYRDLPFTAGIQYTKGLHMRVASDQDYECPYEPIGARSVFVMGMYSDASAN